MVTQGLVIMRQTKAFILTVNDTFTSREEFKNLEDSNFLVKNLTFVCVELYGQVNPTGSCRAR